MVIFIIVTSFSGYPIGGHVPHETSHPFVPHCKPSHDQGISGLVSSPQQNSSFSLFVIKTNKRY